MVLIGVALVAMSISGTAIALPDIGNDLDAAGSPLNWVVAGYNLAFAAMTLVAGAAADRAGRRGVFIIAAALFAARFIATAAAPTIQILDIARVVSGVGGAGVMAAGGALLAQSYEGAARNRAFALMGTMAGVGIAVGPTLIGAMISVAGWRGSFGIFAAVAALVTIAATRLAESRNEAARTDWIGSSLFVVTLTAIMFSLLEGPEYGWTHPAILTGFGIGLAAAIMFAVSQRRSSAPILAPELVAHRGFMGWCLATLTTSIGFLGALVFLPTYLQAVSGHTPITSGLVMLLLTAPVLVSPMLAATLVNRGVAARLLILIALVLVVVGNVALLTLRPEHTVGLVAIPLLLIGTGMGISFGITDGQAMALVPPQLVGTAAGFLNTLRGAAEALVIAAFSASLLAVLRLAIRLTHLEKTTRRPPPPDRSTRTRTHRLHRLRLPLHEGLLTPQPRRQPPSARPRSGSYPGTPTSMRRRNTVIGSVRRSGSLLVPSSTGRAPERLQQVFGTRRPRIRSLPGGTRGGPARTRRQT